MEIKPLQRIPPCPGAPEESLSWAPWKKSGVKIDPMNIIFLVQQGHLLACLRAASAREAELDACKKIS